MSDYTTQSIGRDIAQVQDSIIIEEPMARLIFRPQIRNGGVRGRLIRQRRISKDDTWLDDTPIDIRSLEKGESFNVELRTEAVTKLAQVIAKLQGHIETNGVEYGVNKYKSVKADDIVISADNITDVIQKIIGGKYSSEVLKAFVADENIDLTTFADAARIRAQRINLAILESRLRDNVLYKESAGDDSWQKFILNNHWMFGANYLDPIDRAKINISGSMPDFIYPTADGFADILEIKLPEEEVIIQDPSHAGSWKWDRSTNSAIGQVTNYIIDIERLRLDIQKEIKDKMDRDVLLLKPRAYILIGDSTEWTQVKKEALRKLNSVLHGIEVITYKDLHSRASRIIES